MHKLCDRETRQEFQVKIGGAFEYIGDRPVQELWLDFKHTTQKITEKVVGFRRRTFHQLILARDCEDRRKALTKNSKNTSRSVKRTETRTD